MKGEDWSRVQAVFDAALPLRGSQRERFLDEACAGNPSLRAEVASLLAAHDGAGEFIEAPAVQIAADLLGDDPAPSLDGRQIGTYLIRQEIGRGGMGVVYLADDTRLARRVALKAIRPGFGADPVRRQRMRLEARAAAALSHPGIATVYALEEIGNELYLACEYVSGPTLRALIEPGPLPLPQVVDIALQLARALAAAHVQGVVHRDLKPENVVKTAMGVVKILDFGVAKLEDVPPTQLTGDGAAVGTPAYMAPEQIRGKATDFRSDLFAFGLLVYEMASGSNPFGAAAPTATVARILEEIPAPLSRVCPGSPAPLDRIVSICLAKDPQERYGSTGQLVADLERVEREVREAPAPAGQAATPPWWWVSHQLAISIIYVAMLYPAWRVRPWLPQPWSAFFLPLVAACAAVTATVRLHLWFTARFYVAELAVQREKARRWTRSSDVAFSMLMLAASLLISGAHSEVALLLASVGIATATASFVIEPTTTRAAFKSQV